MMKKWFILSLVTLTLCTVVSATGVLIVKPTNDTPCPQQPCHTLEHYAQSWQLYLTSNTLVQFLPGEHVLEGDWKVLSVVNVFNLTLIGSDDVILDSLPLGIPMAASRISCRRGDTFLYFHNVTGLLVTKLTFSECGGGKATVFLYKVSDLVVDCVTIQNSTGTGMIGINLKRSLIYHSAFVFNHATSDLFCSGNIMLKCSNMNEMFTLNITSSWILFGNSTTKTGCVGGLSLSVDQSCYNMKVHIYNTTLKANVGGNMFLTLSGFSNGIVTIVDSHFEGGYALEFGGGIVLYTRDNALQVSQHVQTNLMYINNTDFVGNSAEFGGAIVLFLGAGTELYINGSTFQNNVAHHGGHISICFHTCANISITINNSICADGKATSGRGGGVEVWSLLHSNSQCTKANHVYIGSTQFVRNQANFSGGAVSLWGCTGTELYIDKSEFYNNTTPLYGGHIALHINSNCIQFSIVNNSHFESGKAWAGGGISVFAGHSCTSLSSTIHKSVYILNSKVSQNIADVGGGLTVQFNHTCFAVDVLIHNVSLSGNAGTNFTGGNIYLTNMCAAGNSITISKSTVEFGTSPVGGGMAFLTGASPGCPASMINLKPTSVNIVDSTFQHNTARKKGGGLAISLGSFECFCCGAQMDITNVTFFNNKANTVSYGVNETETFTTGGNICIDDSAGQWPNNSVRIQNCLIEGGLAEMGGGIYVNSVVFCQKSIEMEALIISNTQFKCNQATRNYAGTSLMVMEMPHIYNTELYSTTTITNIKKLTIRDTTFDGTCANSSIAVIWGMGTVAPYLLTQYNVVFINVSFKGYSTDLSSPPSPIHSQQLFDNHITLNLMHAAAVALYLRQLPAVMLSYIPNATFIDCEFFESTEDSGLAVENTNVFFGGNTTFRDNKAIYGGGLSLLDNSIMYLTPNTSITFSHNHATYAGGAIYVESDDFSPGSLKCFYQFDGINQDISDLNIQITFKNNTAYFAGSALYGGLVDFCTSTVPPKKNDGFDSIFKVQNTDDDPTAISSDPHRVCPCNGTRPVCGKLCKGSSPHCNSKQVRPMYTYPGALLQIQAVVVGQKDGIVPGVVRATLGNTSAVLGDLQYSQATGKSCTTLNYNVFSSQIEETITLMTETIPKRLTLKGLIINVTLLNCPWGFTLRGAPTKCDCVDKLREHQIYQCNITTKTISRPPPLWIGYYYSGNNTEHPVEGVLVHDHCPFDYCKLEQLSIQLNDSDKQCAFNHSGILCGACQLGLSLALGTSRCLKCSNKYLMLLFAFAVAGFALVFLLTLTNMTVSEGTINGLIFYANIIHINQAIFFPIESAGINTTILDILFTFISWINLDLGIETCFYNGMDMYTKTWLQFLFPIYIWTIVGGMIVSSHYSTTAAKLFRRHAVKVLATLFLLSFAKLQRTIITALSFTFLTYPDGTKTVWLYDSNIEYLLGKHIPLFIAALLALLFLLIPYTLVLFFIQCLLKFNCQIFFWVKKLKPLFDAYTGPYKDRYRFWTGFLLIVRTILFLIFTLGNPGLNLAAISVTSTCLAFSPTVYKKVWLTLLEYSLLLNLSVVSVATFYCRYTQFSGNQAVVVYLSVGTTLITFVGIMVYHLYQCTINSRVWKTVSDQVAQRSSDCELVNIAAESSDGEEEPAQAEIRPLMLQFNEYREPLLAYDD